MLWRVRGCVYGAAPHRVLIVTRRRGVFGDFAFPVLGLAEKVKTRAIGLSDPADCGGVNVNAATVAGAELADVARLASGWAVVGVVSGNAELGVSG